MSHVEQLVARIESSPIGRRLDRLGAFSPLATLRTFAPGAQALLAATEASAERALHVARAVFVVMLAIVELFVVGVATRLPLWAPFVASALLAALWLLAWRQLLRPRPPYGLKFALILFDTYATVHAAVVVRSGAFDAFALGDLVRPEDLLAVVPPMLVLVALAGSFRLDPRVAVFSMLCALAAWTFVALSLDYSTAQSVAVGAVIWCSGVIGANAARLFRHMALKAAEQAVLERYVPEALTRELVRTGDPAHVGREVDITVLIVDIRGYTRRSERLTPAETVRFLNDYFSIVVAPLAAHGAVLDKYIGDGVHSFFEGAEHEQRALTAAREILRAVDAYNAGRPAHEPIAIGIALHSGPALVGTIGSEHKREYTAIADTVNVAARLEELNKRFGARVVASEAVVAAGRPEHIEGFVGPELTDIRGRDSAVRVHYLPMVASS